MLFSQNFKKTCLNLIKLKNSNNSDNLDNSQQSLLLIISELNDELLTAVKQFDLEKVKILLDQGADPNMFDNNQIPLILLIVNMYTDAQSAELLKLLINNSRYKFNLDQQNEQGETALIILIRSYKSNIKAIQVLLEAGADVNVCDNRQRNAIFYVVMGKFKIFEYKALMEHNNSMKVAHFQDEQARQIGAKLAKLKYREELLGQNFFNKLFNKKTNNHVKKLSEDAIQNIGSYLYPRSRVILEFMDGFYKKKQKYQQLQAKKLKSYS